MTTPAIMPEFSHTTPLSEIGLKPVHHTLVANDAERAAMAKRFGGGCYAGLRRVGCAGCCAHC